MEWFFPDDINSTIKLLKKDNILHGGGTGILMGTLKNIKGIISLDRLDLNYIKEEKDNIVIGSTATFTDIINNLRKFDKNNILIKSLSKAASTPLRNRITIGGSIAFSPLWSDLLGPLITLDAKIKVLGENNGTYSILEFIRNPEIKKNSLIKEVYINTEFTDSRYFSFRRTSFDFSIFNISIVYKKKNKNIQDIKIALWGTRDKEKRMYELEDILIKENFIDEGRLKEVFRPEFYKNIYFSQEYLEEISRIEIYRILKDIYEW